MIRKIVVFAIYFTLMTFASKTSFAQTCGGGPVYYGNKITSCVDSRNGNTGCDPKTNPFCTCTSSCPPGHGGQIGELCGDYSGNCAACASINLEKSNWECGSGSCVWNGNPATCSLCYTGWQNTICGGGSCLGTQMHQRNVASGTSGICSTRYRCIDSASCSAPTDPKPTNTPTPTVTPTPTNTPTPTPTTAPSFSPYFKLKDTSFYKIGILSSNFPIGYTAYDATDNVVGGYFNQGEAGAVISSGDSLSAGDGGTSISGSLGNPRNWTALNYSGGNSFTTSQLLNYVRAKKNSTEVIDIMDLPSSGAGGTYSLNPGNVIISSPASFGEYITVIVDGDLTLSVNDLGKDGIVFIVDGDVTVNGSGGVFNGSNRPFAVISTGTITFANSLTEADGLFVGNSVYFGSGSTALKIVGNVSSSTASSLDRDRATAQPSMFVVFDPRHYTSIIDKLSTTKSTWTQLQ